MADQYDPNAIHNRGKQRINGSLTVTGGADFGEVPTVNGKHLKTDEIFTDVIHITDTTPIEKIYDVSKYALTYAEIKVNNGTNCKVIPVMTQKNASDDEFVDVPDKFSLYYTASTTSKLAVQNLFTKEKLKISVSCTGDGTGRTHYPDNILVLSGALSGSSSSSPLINILDAHNILLKCIKGGYNSTSTSLSRYSSDLTYQQETATSYCGRCFISGTVPTAVKGIYRLYVNIISHTVSSTTNEIYFNYFIMDEESDEIVVTSPANCFVDLKSSNPIFPLGSDFYGLYINFSYDDELGELTGLEGNQNHFNAGDTLISSEILGYPVFSHSVDDGDETSYEPVGYNPNAYVGGIFGENAYFYFKNGINRFNRGDTYTISIDPATVDATITFKAF